MTTAVTRLLALVVLLPLSVTTATAEDLLRTASLGASIGHGAGLQARAVRAPVDADARDSVARDDVLLPLTAAVPLRLAVGSLTAPLPGHGARADGFRAGLAVTPGPRSAGLRAELSWFEARLADARGAAEPDRGGIARRGLLLRVSRSLGRF